MLKKISIVIGIIGGTAGLLPNLWQAIMYLLNPAQIDFGDIYSFGPLIYFAGMALLSAAALIGTVLVYKKRKPGGILLIVSGGLILVFGFVMYAIISYVPVLLIIAAGVLALIAKDEDTEPPAKKTVDTL